MITSKQGVITVEDITQPTQLAQAAARRSRFDLNWAWFEAHAPEIYAACRGKCVCIAGRELFVADAAEQALGQAYAAHPDDDGRFTLYIPKERMIRIYAHRGCMGSVSGRDPAACDPR
jgi:hypothetical protein